MEEGLLVNRRYTIERELYKIILALKVYLIEEFLEIG